MAHGTSPCWALLAVMAVVGAASPAAALEASAFSDQPPASTEQPLHVSPPAGKFDQQRFGGDIPAAAPASDPAPSKFNPDRFGAQPFGATAPASEFPPASPADEAAASDTFNPARFGKQPDAAYGAFQRGLYVTAYNLALVRAKNGDPAAQALVAEILARGLGVPRDAVGAARWYSLAAEQGIPEAQFQYALMLLDGRYVKRDVKGAYALLEAAAEAGNTLAQFNLAQLIVDREPGAAGMAKAIYHYERAAEAGLADAQYALAQVLFNGAGGKTPDEAQARKWLERSARQGYDTAELDLGTWLVEGRGGKKDAKAGYNLLRRAALGGNVAAQNRLAKLYMQGIGTDPDNLMAAAWYILARRAGLFDPEMDDLLNGLTPEETKQAIEKANRLR